MSMEMNKALDLLREIRPSIPKEVLELWCKDRDAFLASHPAVEQAGANVGHGHVFPRADGVKMRCGGPGLCSECTADASRARAALAQPSPALPPFAEKVLAKLRRFYDCASDFESGGVDIGRHWLDLLTQLGLLNRVQRSPALWEISQQGEDLLGMPQPSPAQAEAERPEVVAYLFVKPDGTLSMDAVRHKPSQPAVAVMTVAQHERIVVAEKGKTAAEMLESHRQFVRQFEEGTAELIAQRDAALARVEQQERTIAGMNEAHAKLAGLYEAAQAQHSVPEASEQEKEQGWTLDYRFVELVTEIAASRMEFTTSMEATEQVLLAARELLAAEAQALREEVAALRARVVVVPNRLPRSSDIASIHQHSIGWNACLDELARLNGLAVSEGLVQGMAKFAREIICGALDGGSFDGADIQESAERHGLIAKQVMNEPCRGPEEYCACAWSTSFPAECYRVTPKLRALLNEDKENGNG